MIASSTQQSRGVRFIDCTPRTPAEVARYREKLARLTRDGEPPAQPAARQATPSTLPADFVAFSCIAASGNAFRQENASLPIVVDIASVLLAESLPLPIRFNHDPQTQIGTASQVTRDGSTLFIRGHVFTRLAKAAEIVTTARTGKVWRASIGANPGKVFRTDGRPFQLNGKTIQGPCLVYVAAKLTEVSFVEHGADPETIVSFK